MKSVALDPDSGLPALPEGYYWRVDRGKLFGPDVLYVYVVGPSLIFSGANVDIANAMMWHDTPEGIRAAATRLYRWNRALKKRIRRQEYDAATAHLRGKYPPKKVGGAK